MRIMSEERLLTKLSMEKDDSVIFGKEILCRGSSTRAYIDENRGKRAIVDRAKLERTSYLRKSCLGIAH
jgi:hypothetical protein